MTSFLRRIVSGCGSAAALRGLFKAGRICLIPRSKFLKRRSETSMTIKMLPADPALLARRDDIVAALRAIVPGEGVIDSAAEMLPYESDGLMAYRQPPMVVVLPDTTEQVSRLLKYCF